MKKLQMKIKMVKSVVDTKCPERWKGGG